MTASKSVLTRFAIYLTLRKSNTLKALFDTEVVLKVVSFSLSGLRGAFFASRVRESTGGSRLVAVMSLFWYRTATQTPSEQVFDASCHPCFLDLVLVPFLSVSRHLRANLSPFVSFVHRGGMRHAPPRRRPRVASPGLYATPACAIASCHATIVSSHVFACHPAIGPRFRHPSLCLPAQCVATRDARLPIV